MKSLSIMVSGGLDSYIAYRIATADNKKIAQYEDIIPIFVNLGQPYAQKELQTCKKLFGEELIIVDSELYKHQAHEATLLNPEIFGRNTLCAFFGAVYSDITWLCALETEMTRFTVRDKQPEFFHLCSSLFTFVFKAQREETIVLTPFHDISKTEMIKLALVNEFVTHAELMETVSCYHSEKMLCGKCLTCFKRWIAMTNNGIHEPYEAHPYYDNAYAIDTVKAMRFELQEGKLSGKYTKKRIIETMDALSLIGIHTDIFFRDN